MFFTPFYLFSRLLYLIYRYIGRICELYILYTNLTSRSIRVVFPRGFCHLGSSCLVLQHVTPGGRGRCGRRRVEEWGWEELMTGDE